MKKGILNIIFFGILGLLCPALSGAQTTTDSINSGTSWLLSVRYGIGLWALSTPPDPLQTEFTEDDFTPTYMRDTLEAIGALQATGVSITEFEPTLNWLEHSYISSTEQLGQKIKILSKAGRDATQAITDISASHNSDGGFGGAAGYPSNVLDTAMVLQGLAASGSSNAATINQAASYLISAQNVDGGWGFVKGDISRVYYTALVMQALSTQSKTASIANSLSRASTYLISQKQAGGSWGNVADTSLAFQALIRSTLNSASANNAVAYLLSTQLPDGSWDTDVYTTALALQAINDSLLLQQDIDNDGDGFTKGQGDCDDLNPAIHPGAQDLTANGVDEDCNGIDGPPVGDLDGDGDGFTQVQGDCNDADPGIHPGAIDIPNNGIDEDCNGQDAGTSVQITSVNLFKMAGADRIPTTLFGTYETIAIEISVNDLTVPLSLFIIDPAGQILDVRSEAGEFRFETQNNIPGNYAVTIRALDAYTSIILDEKQVFFTIQAGVGIADTALGIFPRFTHVGATETVTVALSLTNRSNTSLSLTIEHEVKSPSGAIINSSSTPLTLTPDMIFASITLATFSYTFPESGDYPIQVKILNGTELLVTVNSAISSSPAIRIDPTKTISPTTVTPDGDKRIRINIHLEGVEQKP